MTPRPPAPARFVLLGRSPSAVRVRLDVPVGVVVRNVFVGFIAPGTNIGPEGVNPGRVVDATADGVGEGQHTYALESDTADLPIERVVWAGYTVASAPGSTAALSAPSPSGPT